MQRDEPPNPSSLSVPVDHLELGDHIFIAPGADGRDNRLGQFLF